MTGVCLYVVRVVLEGGGGGELPPLPPLLGTALHDVLRN